MRYALFIGCQIPARVAQYEASVRAVLKKLRVRLVDERQFNCCGYPMRNSNQKAFLLSSVRNLALAERSDLQMLVLCKCCYGSLKKAEHFMKEDGDLQDEIRRLLLREEGLKYEGMVGVSHLLSVLYHDIGVEFLKEKISTPFKDLKIAAHYGCHALRPSSITQFDDPVAPTIFDELVEVTGATSIDWTKKLECCGAPAMGVNDDLSMALTIKKLDHGKAAGAEYICTACPYCQIQFDTVQQMILSKNGGRAGVGSVLYPQLLGLSMGMSDRKLGINMNRIDISSIRSYLKEE
ncbi:MAG: CoB--CoM heterodisulfide reductase iron-sulfur subunit B family protein [Deltaproteobacteria bacterium]|nr:CoB--CoM heterodisulfide reductase iron-sulfur subunit B family protein [Deltaproteobacteria bacterium]